MSVKVKYGWKRNNPGVDAKKAANYLRKLETKYGNLTPELIVKESKKKNSVLHRCFEWNDKKAAVKYRLDQARYILRSITIEVEEIEVRAFANVIIEDEGVYVSMQTAKSNKDLKKQVIKKAYKELIDWKERYEHIKEFMSIRKAIDDYDKD